MTTTSRTSVRQVTQKAVLARIRGLAPEQARPVVCALVGHSRVVSMFFGYVSCHRCGAQIGDTLGGVFDLEGHVIVGHDCEVCRTNMAQLKWRDLLATPPLPAPEAEPA